MSDTRNFPVNEAVDPRASDGQSELRGRSTDVASTPIGRRINVGPDSPSAQYHIAAEQDQSIEMVNQRLRHSRMPLENVKKSLILRDAAKNFVITAIRTCDLPLHDAIAITDELEFIIFKLERSLKS